MRSGYALVLVFFLLAGIFFAGCASEDTPAPAPEGMSIQQEGVLIQNIGNVTGQGVILQGVPRGTIDTITFAIRRAPGTSSVDLNNMTVAYTDAVRTEILLPAGGYREDPAAGYWGIIAVENEAGNPNMRLEYEERYVIRVNPKAAVVPDQIITISLKPTEGRPLIIRRVAPSTIFENDNILPGL